MQTNSVTNSEWEARTQPCATVMPSRQLRCHAVLAAAAAAAVLPACGIPAADAGTQADQPPQSILVASAATCRTAPARNNPRKRAAVAEVYRASSFTSSMVLPSLGTAFGAPQLFSQDGGFSSLDRWSAGDFDGDGDQDLIAAWDNGGITGLALRRSTGTSFVTSHVTIPSVAWSADTIWVPGDFDNDGDSDLAAVLHDGASTSIDVYSSTGSGFLAPQRRMTQGIPWVSTTKWSVGDFNGDLKDDLVSVANSSGLASTVVWLSNTSATAFIGSIWSNVGGWSDATSYVAGDYNGDGKADLAGIWDNGGLASIAVYPSSGTGFFYPGHWLLTNQWFNSDDRWVAGYYNDDNKADLVQAWDNDRVSWRTAYLANAAGTAFAFGFGANAGTGDWKLESSICAGVFNAL